MTNDVQGGDNRPSWAELPPRVRLIIEAMADGQVIDARSARGGFSPGFASTLTLSDGRRVFAKAMSDLLTPGGADLYRQEQRIISRLPPTVPTPRLLDVRDDGEWIALLYEFADGYNPVPSRPTELAAMLETYRLLSDQLDPSPLTLDPFENRWTGRFDQWADLSGIRAGTLAEAFPWAAANLETIAHIASEWRTAVHGEALVHGDLRADNMILTAHGVLVVDWPESCIGAPWLDLVLALPSMSMFRGGPAPEQIVHTHPLTVSVDPANLDSAIAGLAGFFAVNSLKAPPPGLPTLREFQRLQAIATLEWLKQRLHR
jgi:hypothetical protein